MKAIKVIVLVVSALVLGYIGGRWHCGYEHAMRGGRPVLKLLADNQIVAAIEKIRATPYFGDSAKQKIWDTTIRMLQNETDNKRLWDFHGLMFAMCGSAIDFQKESDWQIVRDSCIRYHGGVEAKEGIRVMKDDNGRYRLVIHRVMH